jgi:dethiobiotin synthetase
VILPKPLGLPCLFVTATDTSVGKTLVAAAIARSLRMRGRRVAVLKPAASGCYRAREGLISEDAELLAAASDTHHPLDLICPNRYEEPLAPGVAARRAKTPMDWDAVERSIRLMSTDSDCMIVEGAGGVLVPADDRHTILDLIVALGVPAIVVARPSLGTINHTLLSVEVLRNAGVRVAGVVINRYPSESAGVAEETSPREIEKFGKVPVLSIVPDEPFSPPTIGPGVMAAIGQVDWESKMSAGSISRQS